MRRRPERLQKCYTDGKVSGGEKEEPLFAHNVASFGAAERDLSFARKMLSSRPVRGYHRVRRYHWLRRYHWARRFLEYCRYHRGDLPSHNLNCGMGFGNSGMPPYLQAADPDMDHNAGRSAAPSELLEPAEQALSNSYADQILERRCPESIGYIQDIREGGGWAPGSMHTAKATPLSEQLKRAYEARKNCHSKKYKQSSATTPAKQTRKRKSKRPETTTIIAENPEDFKALVQENTRLQNGIALASQSVPVERICSATPRLQVLDLKDIAAPSTAGSNRPAATRTATASNPPPPAKEPTFSDDPPCYGGVSDSQGLALPCHNLNDVMGFGDGMPYVPSLDDSPGMS